MLLVYGGGPKQQMTRWNQGLSGAKIKKGVQDKISRRVRIQSQGNKNPVLENPKSGNH